MGRIMEATPGADGKVRNVKVQYKNSGSFVTIDRAVQRYAPSERSRFVLPIDLSLIKLAHS